MVSLGQLTVVLLNYNDVFVDIWGGPLVVFIIARAGLELKGDIA
jgi:hypothetical protein